MKYPKTKIKFKMKISQNQSYLLQPAVFLPRRRGRLSSQRFPTTTQLRRAHKRLRGPAGLQSLPAQHQQNASVSIWQLGRGLFHNRNAQLQCTSERSSSSCKLNRVWQDVHANNFVLTQAKVERLGEGRGSWHEASDPQRYPSPAISPRESSESNPLRHHQQSRTIFRCVSSKS